jgi:acetyl esterase
VTYDPQLAPYVTRLPAVDLSDVTAARAEMERVRAEVAGAITLRDVQWADRNCFGTAGTAGTGTSGTVGADAPVAVRVYEPARRAADPTPAVLFLHGGGFVMGSVESEHAAAGVLSVALGVVVVSVDYRLAPEHPYPAALEDSYRAVRWLHDEAGPLRIDPARVAVVGHSAGGGLAAALAILARDRGGPPICFQYLGIPELDDRLSTASSRAFVDTPLWNRSAAVLSWTYYLGDLHGRTDVPITAAPARAEPHQLAGLPPAYVSAMENDPLRDEAIKYALALLEAGVCVELHAFPGTFHGSAQIPDAAPSKRERKEMIACLRAAFGLPVQ